MNDLHIGDTGYAKIRHNQKFCEGVTTFGKIIELKDDEVVFQDNEDFVYKVKKDKFKFIKEL